MNIAEFSLLKFPLRVYTWTNNEIKVICCTVSFAMGIDKPDVRAVIHYTMPKTIENYV